MTLKPALIFSLIISTAALYACKQNEAPDDNLIAAPGTTDAALVTEQPGHCQINDIEFAHGLLLDDTLKNTIQAQTGAKILRVLLPNQAVTMEYNPQRVNVTVDQAQKIILITCG